MLNYQLTHPQILAALASAGHGSKVLIADGNYPFSTATNPRAPVVYLNLMPGMLLVTDALKAIISAVPVEAAEVMQTPDGADPAIFGEFREHLPGGMALHPIERFAFYETVRAPDLALTVATGDQRLYANILLTIGVRTGG